MTLLNESPLGAALGLGAAGLLCRDVDGIADFITLTAAGCGAGEYDSG